MYRTLWCFRYIKPNSLDGKYRLSSKWQALKATMK